MPLELSIHCAEMFLPKANRKIIPRWRDFLTTAALGQLAPSSAAQPELPFPTASELEAREAWRRHRTLWHALDLLGSAFVIGDTNDEEVQSAATYVSKYGDDCPSIARVLAEKLLNPRREPEVTEAAPENEEMTRREIHLRRLRLQSEARNSILWVDLARLYTNLGEKKKAERAIENAYYLASENRFILLAATRFFVHIGEHDRALRILRTNSLSETDPWVTAAEIGVSTFSKASPRLLKSGRRMLSSGDFSEFSTSELASAIATVELDEGNTKGAKKLFKQSLGLPTENSLAQAEWASAQLGNVQAVPQTSNIPRNYEAKALHAYRLAEWDDAVWNARQWLSDQPFSSRPVGVVSYLYSTILERYEEALRVLKLGLLSNPGDRGLVNNLAFALINLDRLADAESELGKINPTAVDDLSKITLVATRGLLLFRKGFPVQGRNLYLEAISLAKRDQNRHYAALAALYLAIEEIQSDTETKVESLKMAADLALATHEPDVKHVLSRALALAKTPTPK